MKKLAKYISLGLIAGLIMTGCGNEMSGTAVSTDSGVAASENAAAADTDSSVAAGTDTAVAAAENTAPQMDLASFNASDYVKLADYSEIVINASDVEPTDEQLQQKIDEFTTSHAPADYAAKDGDTVNIDYVGKKDGVAFDGGTAAGYDLTLGSDTFIDGFEDGLIGTKAGDQVSLDLTFPEDYGAADLAGAAVVFDVTVNSIKPGEPVEYTDELVAANTDYDSTEKYNEFLKDSIRKSNTNAKSSEAFMNLGDFTGEYPDGLANYYYDYYIQMYKQYYGPDSLKEAAADYDSERDYMKEYLGEGIKQQMNADLLLLAIAENEKIACEGEDYDAYLDGIVKQAGVTREELLEHYGEGFVNYSYLTDRAYSLLNDRVVVK